MRVTWTIDIDDTDDPREAAAQALAIMQDPGSTAVVFEVVNIRSWRWENE